MRRRRVVSDERAELSALDAEVTTDVPSLTALQQSMSVMTTLAKTSDSTGHSSYQQSSK